MVRKQNYQTFYPTKNLTLLDAEVGQPNGWVSKDGMWAAVPSNGRKSVSYTHLTLPTTPYV